MFKGYIITDGKVPLRGETFKNKTSDELRSFDEVKNIQDYAGIIEDGIIVVDVDDTKQADILLGIVKDLELDTKVYKTTRGMHFYFRTTKRTTTNRTGAYVGIGLKVDMKLGIRNSYVGLKVDGVEREVIYDTGSVEDIPIWLTPINYTFPFLDMENGDGRNQAMFSYILTLMSNGYSKEESRETLRIINKHVLEDSLEDRELETLMRDEAFDTPVFYGGESGNKFLFHKFAKFLESEHNIISINSQLHVYDEGIYIEGDRNLERKMIEHIPSLRHSERQEVLRYLKVRINKDTRPSAAHLVAFNNGIYDLSTDEFVDFDESYIITNKIPHNYNPSSYSKLADHTLNKMACFDPEIRALMEEAIGYTFYRRNEMGKAFILTGDRANGKSTYLHMIRELLGVDNYTTLDLNELGERFKTAELFGKLANIGDDIGTGYIKDTSVFKKLVTGEALNVERKGADPFDLSSYAKMMFSANEIPRMADNTGAVLRRLVIVPFNATFSTDDADYDPFIRHKLQTDEVMEYLINIGLAGLKRVLENNDFTESVQVIKSIEDYELENNPLKLFILEQGEDDIIDCSTSKVYSDYMGFCAANGYKPIGRRAFSRRMNTELGTVSSQARIDGKRVSIFTME